MEQPQFCLSFFFDGKGRKEASTKVIVAKMVIIINHLAARTKSGSL